MSRGALDGERQGIGAGEAALLGDHLLGGTGRKRSGREQFGDQRIEARIERRLAWQDLVHQPDPQRPLRSEALAGGEQRPGMSLTDARQHERADDRRDEAQLRLGETEGRVSGGQRHVRHAAERHAAAQGGAVDPCDHRHHALVDGGQHGLQATRIGLVLLHGQVHGGPLPFDIGPRAERLPVAGQHDGPQRLGRFSAQRRKRVAQRRDQLGVEGIAHLRPGEHHACDDARALDPQHAAHRPPRR